MTKLKILIVEDEILIAELIKFYIEEKGHTASGIAISYEEAVREYNLQKPDLILLDIRLYGEKSGIDFATYVHNSDEFLPIIYLSSQYDQKTLASALKTNPFGYLTKPIQKESLWTSVEVAYAQYLSHAGKEKTIEIFDGKTHHVIKTGNIIYVESDHVYVHIYTSDGVHIHARKTMTQMMDCIKDSSLIRCHRSFIINTNFIKSRNSESIVLENNVVIPVSRSKKNNIHF